MHTNIIKLESIDSTNVWARKNLAVLNNFDVVSAEVQTTGHGQFERQWFSTNENGGNIYISIVLKPENIEHLNELTRFTALMVSDVLKENCNLKPDFKFPNDILINGKKICGILAESVFLGSDFKGVVVGIGINLNLSFADIKKIDIPATSVFAETGKNIDKYAFLDIFTEHFKKHYEDFLVNGITSELSYSK